MHCILKHTASTHAQYNAVRLCSIQYLYIIIQFSNHCNGMTDVVPTSVTIHSLMHASMTLVERKKNKNASSCAPVNTNVPMQQNTPAKKALKGKLPTIMAYTTCSPAVTRAEAANISKTWTTKRHRQSNHNTTICTRFLHQ